MAYGASVAQGAPSDARSVVDVVPTMLYFLGLPIGRDMDGYARTDLFCPSFTEQRPSRSYPPTNGECGTEGLKDIRESTFNLKS